MKRIRYRADEKDSPRKSTTTVGASSPPTDGDNSSSWEDDVADGDEDAKLWQHDRNLDEFRSNVPSFLDEFRDVAAGEICASTANAEPLALTREMEAVSRPFNRLHLKRQTQTTPSVYGCDTEMVRLLAEQEASADAFCERNFGPLLQQRGDPAVARPPPENVSVMPVSHATPSTSAIVAMPSAYSGVSFTLPSPSWIASATSPSPMQQLPSRTLRSSCTSPPLEFAPTRPSTSSVESPSPVRIASVSLQSRPEIASVHLSPCGIVSGEPIRSADDERWSTTTGDAAKGDGLPAFLAALKSKYDDDDGHWCSECGVPASLVPAHWSDSFHRSLHQLRSAIPAPSALADGIVQTWTVNTTGVGGGYSVFRIDRYDGEPMRRVRAYVDAELGVSETGFRWNKRLAYVSTTIRRRRGEATVIGYLEVEPVTELAYVLMDDGHTLSPDGRRPVKYGVARLWVALGHRRRRVGTNMLNAFRAEHLVRGRDMAFAAHEIQFGDTFVRHYRANARSTQEDDGDDAAVLIYNTSTAWYK